MLVSGHLGEAALGLIVLETAERRFKSLRLRQLRPTPQVALQ
ncbi:MAG: hypothetical protein R3C68_09720 [Myxococcota bacterium]